MGDGSQVPALAGVHHLKLPVRDLDRSRDWYTSRLGYRVATEFVEDGRLMGLGLEHPNGGPDLGESHAGVHRASLGWVLPMLHDPDGHEVRFYTHAHHTETAPDAVVTFHDPRKSAERADALPADATPEPRVARGDSKIPEWSSGRSGPGGPEL